MTDNTIPHDREIERAVISNSLNDPETVVEQVRNAGEGLFYIPEHEIILKAIDSLIEEKADTSMLSVIARLKESGHYEKIGGEPYLLGLYAETLSSANSLYYIEMLVGYAVRRKLYMLSRSTIQQCESMSVKPEDIIGGIYEQLSNIKLLIAGKDKGITEKIKEYLDGTDGDVSVTDMDRELTIVTKRDKNTRRKVMQRLKDSGIIEKASSRRGHYRKIDSTCEAIDWKSSLAEPYDISFPMGLDAFVKIYPGNLIVVAGESNAGKTAFLLNLVKLNMKKHVIHYFSSEMGAEEFKIRLDSFDDIKRDEWNFHPKERSSHFGEAVVSGAFNIIDFLEVHDEFYKMGAYMKQIFDNIGSGIAVVAIQKNPGAMHGLGGARSIEKARLYITLERPGKIVIRKAKNYRHKDINPNGYEADYKIVHGCKFSTQGGWHKGEDE